MIDICTAVAALDSERLFTATPTELLVDIGQDHLKGRARRTMVSRIGAAQARLALRVAAGHLPALMRERALLDRACEMRDEAVARAQMLHCAEVDAEVSVRRISAASALVGGQDGDDLEARLAYALALVGAVPGETLVDACSRASAERDELTADLVATALKTQGWVQRSRAYEHRAVEAERDREQFQAELVLARRPWWRRLADWLSVLP